MNLRVTWLVFLIVGLVLATPASAQAPRYKFMRPKTAEALALLKAGDDEYDRGHWLSAAERYSAGRAVEDASIFDYDLGQCYRLAGDYSRALVAYERFLDRGTPTGEVLASVQGFVAEMRAQLERTRAMPPTHAAPDPAVAAVPSPSRPEPAPAPQRSSAWRYVGIGLGAAGLLGGAATTYLAIDAHAASTDAKDISRPMSERIRLSDRAESRSKAAVIVGVGSGLAIVAGLAALLIPSRGETHDATAWNVHVSSNGFALSGQF